MGEWIYLLTNHLHKANLDPCYCSKFSFRHADSRPIVFWCFLHIARDTKAWLFQPKRFQWPQFGSLKGPQVHQSRWRGSYVHYLQNHSYKSSNFKKTGLVQFDFLWTMSIHHKRARSKNLKLKMAEKSSHLKLETKAADIKMWLYISTWFFHFKRRIDSTHFPYLTVNIHKSIHTSRIKIH